MAQSTDIPYRYATAWLDAADVSGVLPRIREEKEVLDGLLEASEEFGTFLQDRTLPPPVKQDIMNRLFQGRVQGITLNFLLLTVSKKREHLLPEILEACDALLDDRDGIVNAVVTSAVALTAHQSESLRSKLESYTGKQIRMGASVDAGLLGGFVASVGDTVFDSSVRVQMQRVRRALIGR